MQQISEDLLDQAELARLEAIDAGLKAVKSVRDGGALGYLVESSRREASEAMLGLITVNPFDGEAVRALQWQVTRYHALVNWIIETVEEGAIKDSEMTAERASELMVEMYGQDEAMVEG